ncbi:MAG: NUDIX hydrolase [Muribaculaceae bacterium]
MNTSNDNYTYQYPHPAVATDCVIFGYDGNRLQVLLVERGIEPFKGSWALPGGFVRENETAEDGARRELFEETGINHAYIKQLKAYSAVERDPRERVISIAFFALVKSCEVKGGDDASQARWFNLDEVPRLAFDHQAILQDAVEALRREIHFEPVGFELLPERFTIRELQNLYEQVLKVEFDRRNFFNKIRRLGILNRLKDKTRPTAKKDAFLFEFNQKAYNEFKAKHNGFRMEF